MTRELSDWSTEDLVDEIRGRYLRNIAAWRQVTGAGSLQLLSLLVPLQDLIADLRRAIEKTTGGVDDPEDWVVCRCAELRTAGIPAEPIHRNDGREVGVRYVVDGEVTEEWS